MSLDEETELSADATDALLARHETGVLALARDDEAYAIPISYGYDADERTFYIRLVSHPGSEKRRFLESDLSARLVVYEESGDEYRSVVCVGTLTKIDREDISIEEIEQYGEAKRPLFEIWGEGRADLDIQLYEFQPDELSGRVTVVDRSGDE